MIYNCKNIPDISEWNVSNVTNMSYMFYDFINIPDISKWDVSNINNMICFMNEIILLIYQNGMLQMLMI